MNREEIDRLMSIAESQPHAAYAALTHGLASKWTYLSRTVPDISHLFQPLEEAIRQRFLVRLTGQNHLSDAVRDLMALPSRLGGLGITNPVKETTKQHVTSQRVTGPLIDLIKQQSTDFPINALGKQMQAKHQARQDHRLDLTTTDNNIHSALPHSLQRSVEITKETGASTWLTALPLERHGFALSKGAFRDALCLCYGWRPPFLPSHCICNKPFSVEHALSCPHGGFPTIHHNELRDLIAHVMSEVCHNVGIEPPLQNITSEVMNHRTANTEEGARLDIKAQGFGGNNMQSAFFDVRVFNPFAHTYRSLSPSSCYRRNEQEKRRAYDQRVIEVERGCFSPLVFTVSGGMGPTAKVVYKTFAAMIANKHSQSHSETQLAALQNQFFTSPLQHHVS